MAQFDPADITAFRYRSYTHDAVTGALRLHYELAGRSGTIAFCEEIDLPGAEAPLDPLAREVADRVARLLFLAAGLSYYKAAAPERVEVVPPVTEAELGFLTELIGHGLTEFAYVNDLPSALTPKIEAAEIDDSPPPGASWRPARPGRALIPVGGGKDSIVTIEAVRSTGPDPVLFSVNSYRPIQATVDRSGLDYVMAARRLSRNLMDLNAAGARNGHVPVTAVNSLIALLSAVRVGSSAVVMSNERSASVGNTVWQGVQVNHQWSKSRDFEALLRSVLAEVVSPELTYFSLLRPYSELRIARQFARLTAYHDVFTSCNKAFRLDRDKRLGAWCGDCPKCRFVFLILAPYLGPEELVPIFGKNLFAEEGQIPGFEELIGVQGHKPLECVGEIEESRLALLLAAESGRWDGDRGSAGLIRSLPPGSLPTPGQRRAVLEASGDHFVPESYQEAMDALA